MELTITSQQILAAAALIGALSAIWAVVSKPFKAMRDITKRLDNIETKLTALGKAVDIQGDMVYQLLDHAATNNAAGEMQRALDQYNKVFRHRGGN